MKIRHAYLALCILGLLIPNAPFWQWLVANGLDPQRFIQDLFANGVSAFFGLDVVLAAVALIAFVLIEGARLQLRRRWMPIAATCLVGVSFGLPMFLYMRQSHLDHRQPA